jgi:hypothetical protein
MNIRTVTGISRHHKSRVLRESYNDKNPWFLICADEIATIQDALQDCITGMIRRLNRILDRQS